MSLSKKAEDGCLMGTCKEEEEHQAPDMQFLYNTGLILILLAILFEQFKFVLIGWLTSESAVQQARPSSTHALKP